MKKPAADLSYLGDVPPTSVIRTVSKKPQPEELEVEWASQSIAPPNDRFLLVFFILILQGAAVLAPWNMFITICYPYFINYKLGNDYANSTGEFSGDRAQELVTWQNDFCNRMTITNQVPNMFFGLVNCFVQFGEHTLGIRITVSIIITIVSFVVTVIMVVVDTSGSIDSVYNFITVSLVIVAFMMAAVGIYQNCSFGLAAPLPMRYSNAIILGNNLTGVLVTLFSIITLVASPDMKIAATVYFIMGIVVLSASLGSYFLLTRLKFYRYHIALRDQKLQNDNEATTSFLETMKIFGVLFRKLWVHYWDVFATYFVTLFAFPNVVMWIAASKDESFFIASSEMYSQVLCFLTFNVFAFLGNILPNWLRFPGPRFLWIFTTARFLFIPFFLLFNFTPPALQSEATGFTRRFDVLIGNSWAFWVVMALLSVSHGHASSLAMMYVPKLAGPAHAGKAASLAAVFLVVGINLGLVVSGSGIVEKVMLTTKE